MDVTTNFKSEENARSVNSYAMAYQECTV